MKKRLKRYWPLIGSVAGSIILAVVIAVSFGHQIVSASSQFFASVIYGTIFPVRLTHEQEVWLNALEWCESRGVVTAVNPKDRDGTPSYYSFQFKPSTFKLYGVRYGLFSRDITDEEVRNQLENYQLQKKMVSLMMDDNKVVWKREFPDCVRRIGLPPLDQ